MPFDLSLYLVLDPVLCEGTEGMLQTAKFAAQSGASLVQLRAPHWSRQELVSCGRQLMRILHPLSVPLIVNNDPIACMEIGADGVHVGQSDMVPGEARRIIGRDKILGFSISNLLELKHAPVEEIHYFGIGPIYATATKSDAAPVMGPELLAKVVQHAKRPCVAIGGIGTHNAKEVLLTGVDGIAVVSAICGKPDIACATKNLAAVIAQFHKRRLRF